jgi:hypothetical protein
MFSLRFARRIVVTDHAAKRMAERHVSEAELLAVIDTGQTRHVDERRLWAYKRFPQRADNLVCAVLVLEDVVVVKTVMHHFTLED